MINRCFEDQEKTLEEIKSLFFNILYLWTAAYVSPLASYYGFLAFLTSFSCILLVYMGAPNAFNDILINYQKNKSKEWFKSHTHPYYQEGNTNKKVNKL